jgi:TetR/AcrR family transcriptional regulator, transcriptional repressor for nem operon
MGRPREFDQELALDKATELFWAKGYERTSIQDICEHTGVHRGSIYDTFGDKNALFLTCLDRFRLDSKNQLFNILDEPGSPKEVLERFFEKVINGAMSEAWQRKGCLMANIATELAPFDSNVASRVEAYSLDVENIFYTLLLRGQKNGNLKSKHNLRELSRFLVNTRLGLYVMSKTATDRKVLMDVSKVALSVLS